VVDRWISFEGWLMWKLTREWPGHGP
jgi:hypothetical protein